VRKKVEKTNRKKRPLRREYIIYASLVVVGAFFAAAALRVLIGGFVEDAEARAEYDQLREDFPVIAAPAPTSESTTPAPMPLDEEDEEERKVMEEETEQVRALSLDELAAINRDFIGWMTVGSIIDYPVVRGSDNNKYINTTFTGAHNTAGAIFMDYRQTNGFSEQVCTIYGHYTRDGSMFAPLVHYLDVTYLQNNPNITITTRNGGKLSYKIFAARLTDAWDVAYSLSVSETSSAREIFPNVPASASRFLLLSTCTRSSNPDERIIVYAAAAD